MIKERKIKQLEESNEQRKAVLVRLNKLRMALEEYDKPTINKTFFEKYFTLHEDSGEVSKNWKGEIQTGFRFSDKQYSFDRFYKRIYLAGSEYLEVQDNTKEGIYNAVKSRIKVLEEWIEDNKKKQKNLRAINETKILKELRLLKDQYKADEIWSELLDEVKY